MKDYTVSILNIGHENEGVKTIRSSSKSPNAVEIIDSDIQEDIKRFVVAVGLEIDWLIEDLECEMEIEDIYASRDYEDGSYRLTQDLIGCNVNFEAVATTEVVVEFDRNNNLTSIDWSSGDYSLDAFEYSVDVTHTDHDEYDYTYEEVIDDYDARELLQGDDVLNDYIRELLNESQFALEEIEE